MGLPLWRNPDESKPKDIRAKSRKDGQFAAARSSIRRRPEVHGRHSARARALQQYPPRLEHTTSVHGLRRFTQRQQDAARPSIPTIQSLFEAADRAISRGSLPPPVPISADVPGEVNATRDNHLRAAGSEENSSHETADNEDLSWEGARRILTSAQWNAPGPRPHSRDGQAATTSHTLPTPPHEGSPDYDSYEDSRRERERILEAIVGTTRPSHPLRYSWRPGSPNVNGLGDRTRSPSPGDGWELMRTTITPDETLPSAENSFASTAASRSFGSSNPSLNTSAPSSQSSISLRAATRRNMTPDAWALIYGELPCNDNIDGEDDENDGTDDRLDSTTNDNSATIDAVNPMNTIDPNPERRRHILTAASPGHSSEGAGRLREEEISRAARRSARALQARREAQRRDATAASTAPGPRTIGADTAAATDATNADRSGPVGAAANTSETVIDGPVSPLSDHSPAGGETTGLSNSDTIAATSAALLDDLSSLRSIVDRIASRDDVPEDPWMSLGLGLWRTRRRPGPRRERGNGAAAEGAPASRNRVVGARVERERNGRAQERPARAGTMRS